MVAITEPISPRRLICLIFFSKTKIVEIYSLEVDRSRRAHTNAISDHERQSFLNEFDTGGGRTVGRPR